MRRFVLLLLVFAALAGMGQMRRTKFFPARPPVAGGGGGGAAFFDNFDRSDADSLGTDWTEAAGDADISSNGYRLGTGSYGVIASVHNTSSESLSQYVKITLDPSNSGYPWCVFRYTDSSSPFYTVQVGLNEGTVEWYYWTDASDTSGDLIGSGSFPGSIHGIALCVTLGGTGTDTTVRCWSNGSNLPTAIDNWDGDTSPDVTITDNPASAVDTGFYVGLGGQQGTADTIRLDNFFGGGL